MAENKRGWLISGYWGLGLECGEESKDVRMALGVQLFFLLESTLKGRDLVLKPLRRRNSW